MDTEHMAEDGGEMSGAGTELRDQALRLLSELPGMIVSSGANLDYAINACLMRVGTLFSASRVLVMLDEKDGKYLRNTHEWMNQTNGPLMFSWPLYDYEYDIPSLKPLLEEHPILVGNSRDLPDDLKKVLGKQGILSFIISPVFRDGKKIGIVGMAFCEKECRFSDDHLFIINGLAGLVSLILDRKQFHTMRCKLNTIKACVDELGPCIEGPVEDDSESIQQNKATTLVDAEKRLIAETLELYNGNKLKTAKHLGLTWPSLDRRCKKLGIDVKRR